MQHECDTSDTSLTWVRHKPHKYDTSATRTAQMRHECYTNNTSAKRVKDSHFDNNKNENIFSHPYIYYMASERLKGEKQVHFKNYLLELSLPRFHAKMHLKSAPQKLNFIMVNAISKGCALNCSCKCTCTFLHSYAQ